MSEIYPLNPCKLDWEENLFDFYVESVASRINILMQLCFNNQCRVRISVSHFAKCEDILSFCEALFQSNNKNVKLSISFFAPKFLLLTIIFKQDNVLQKHLISWHDLILQPPRQANFRAVYLTSFMCRIFNISLSLCFVELSNNCQVSNKFFKSIFINAK